MSDSEDEHRLVEIDYSKCCLCQKEQESQICHPSQNGSLVTYDTLAEDLDGFRELGIEPVPVKIHHFGANLEQIKSQLKSNRACYHRTCRNKCDSQKLKRSQKKAKKRTAEEKLKNVSPTKATRASANASFNTDKPQCIMSGCTESGEVSKGSKLRKALTMQIDASVKKMSGVANDKTLTTKLGTASDMPAMDAYYHQGCYMKLHNAARSAQRKREREKQEPIFHHIIMKKLAAHINACEDRIFTVADLKEMYWKKLDEKYPDYGYWYEDSEGKKTRPNLNSTRFKELLLKYEPDLRDSCAGPGHPTHITHKSTQAKAVNNQYNLEDISDIMDKLLNDASLELHKLITNLVTDPFTGSFTPECLTKDIPQELVDFVCRLLMGPIWDKETEINKQRERVALIICHLLIYNAVKRPTPGRTIMRHNKSRTPAYPIYEGLKFHTQAKLKSQIEQHEKDGISIGYEHLRDIDKAYAIRVAEKIEEEGNIVVPTNLRKGVFTTSDMDNIDQDKRSNLSKEELHGTLISATNHLSHDNLGVERSQINLVGVDMKKVPKLPDNYTVVEPAELNLNQDITLEKPQGTVTPSATRREDELVKEQAWVDHLKKTLDEKLPQDVDSNDCVSWSAFHAKNIKPEDVPPKAVIGVLPPFEEKSSTVPMCKHAMMKVKELTEFCNPGQSPVSGSDLPIYTICKQVQWKWKIELGEDKFVLMLGPLHIEFAVESMLAKLLSLSGFTEILTEANVLTSGRAESVVSESTDKNLKRVRYSHQVYLASCMILKDQAYEKHVHENGYCDKKEWQIKMKDESLMFEFYLMVNDLESCYLRFVRSCRVNDFELFVQCLQEICDWCHALDQTHYERWLPVHIKDMVELPRKHPEVFREFMKGKFVVQRSDKRFSQMGKDQSHEQSVKLMKSDSGIANLFDRKDTMDKHVMALPEKLKAIAQFEEFTQIASDETDSNVHCQHHEESSAFQKQFALDVKNVIDEMNKRGNPFLPETGPRLRSLSHAGDIMDDEQAKVLCNAYQIGKQQHAQYVKERLVDCTKPITDVIPRNSIPLFSTHLAQKNKKTSQLKEQKMDNKLTNRLLLSLIGRPEHEMDDFFTYETRKYPPSLADSQGRMRTGTKSDVVDCLQKELVKHTNLHNADMQPIAETLNNDNLSEPNENEPEPIELDIEANENESPEGDNEPDEIDNETNENESPENDNYLDEPDHFIYSIQVDNNNDPESTDTNSNRSRFNRNSQPTAVFLDGPAIVQMISPKKGVDWDFYAEKQFIPYIMKYKKYNKAVTRIDVIWDVYDDNADNLKQQCHDRRGEKQGPETAVTGSNKAPPGRQKWKNWLNVKANKTALNGFLAKKMTAVESEILTLYSTLKDRVLVNTNPFTGELNGSLSTLAPCSHPEADTRIFAHIKDATDKGHESVLVRTVDSDIPVIGTGVFDQLATLGLQKLYIEYGTSKYVKTLSVHEYVDALDHKAKALPIFQALTGCDTTSSPHTTGKVIAWNTWDLVPGLTDTLIAIQSNPHLFTRDSIHMDRLERWFILMYSKSCGQSRVNKARVALFKSGVRLLDRLPPTHEALFQHIRRSLLQAGFIWSQALILQPTLPPFTDWGWKRNSVGLLVPLWTILEDASKSCKTLISCTCKTSCKSCKCVKDGLRCTYLCKCEGACANNE